MIKRLDVSDGGSAKWCKSVQKKRKRQKVAPGFCWKGCCDVFLWGKWMSLDERCCYR